MEATETKLLTAFHNWAQIYEVRARGTSTAVHEFEERLGLIQEWLSARETISGGPHPGASTRRGRRPMLKY